MWFSCNAYTAKAHTANILRLVILWLLATTSALAIDVQQQVLTRDQWPRYVNGYNLLALPAISHALRQFDENNRIHIVIQYPGGDPGMQWATELYGWLVSFGVPTRYLELEPGSGAVDQLIVTVIDRN
jgi:hypothetical protein